MSPVNRPLEPRARVARLVLVTEISVYAHLKHLGVRDNGIGSHTISINAQRELMNFAFICDITRAREWGPELRALEGGGAESANSAPMKAKITKFLWEVGWLKISIMCNFGDPRSISSG